MSTCRDAILVAFRSLERRTGERDFALVDVVDEVLATTDYKESTIRTHISSLMCRDAPEHHQTTYADLERVSRGRYRRV